MIAKDLVAASSRPLILSLLAEGESYGYALIQRVRELSRGEMEWTDGMLYPVLHRLEKERLIESEWRSAESGRGVGRAGVLDRSGSADNSLRIGGAECARVFRSLAHWPGRILGRIQGCSLFRGHCRCGPRALAVITLQRGRGIWLARESFYYADPDCALCRHGSSRAWPRSGCRF